MNLELTGEEARVLDLVVQNVIKHEDVQASVLAGDQDDIKLINGIAAKVKRLHLGDKKGF